MQSTRPRVQGRAAACRPPSHITQTAVETGAGSWQRSGTALQRARLRRCSRRRSSLFERWPPMPCDRRADRRAADTLRSRPGSLRGVAVVDLGQPIVCVDISGGCGLAQDRHTALEAAAACGPAAVEHSGRGIARLRLGLQLGQIQLAQACVLGWRWVAVGNQPVRFCLRAGQQRAASDAGIGAGLAEIRRGVGMGRRCACNRWLRRVIRGGAVVGGACVDCRRGD